MKRLSLTGYAVIAALLVAGGLYAGWRLYGPKPAKPETYAHETRQQDGSLVLERKPDAKAKPKQAIPKGGTVERVIKIEVQGNPSVSPALPFATKLEVIEDGSLPLTPCPPVTVDLTLVKMPDDTRRVIASSPNGEIISGVDIPIESARPAPAMPKWAAGLSINPLDRTLGVFIDRDFGPFRMGAEINKLSGAAGMDTRVKVGIRF